MVQQQKSPPHQTVARGSTCSNRDATRRGVGVEVGASSLSPSQPALLWFLNPQTRSIDPLAVVYDQIENRASRSSERGGRKHFLGRARRDRAEQRETWLARRSGLSVTRVVVGCDEGRGSSVVVWRSWGVWLCSALAPPAGLLQLLPRLLQQS